MTKLAYYRSLRRLKLREIAAAIGVTPSAVHDSEVRGLLTPRAAMKYAAAFPGVTWSALMEPPRLGADKQ